MVFLQGGIKVLSSKKSSVLQYLLKAGNYWGLKRHYSSSSQGPACMHALEKEMTTHFSSLAWRIPGTEEPGGLPSLGSHRVRHNWSDLAAAAAAAKGTAWAATLGWPRGRCSYCSSLSSLHRRKWDPGLKRIASLTRDCSPTVAFDAQKPSCPLPTLSLLCGPPIRPRQHQPKTQNKSTQGICALVSEKGDRTVEWLSDSLWRLCFFN